MKTTLLAAALLAPVMAFAATNVVVNGSFESPLAGTWNLSGSGMYPPAIIPYNVPAAFGETVPTDTLGATGSPDAAGGSALYFVDDTAAQAVSQSFNLVGGVTYFTGFDYYATTNGSMNVNNAVLTASIVNSSTAISSSTVSLAFAPVATWTPVRSSFTPVSSGSYQFSFVFSSFGNPAKDIVVDRAYVVAVPEPETYGLMVAGLAAMGFMVRRRRA